MQNQTNPKPLGAPMAKMILAVAIIVSLGAALGVAGWVAKNKAVKIQQPQVSPVTSQIINSFTGTLIPGGVECPLFQTDNGTIYSLQGSGKITEGFKDGDIVSIKGKLVERSYCMQGKKTIKLLEINYANDETTDWKTYRNEEYGFEVKYPTNVLKISQKDGYINLFHSISFEHENSCDFGQENALSILKELTDFNIDIKMENSRLLNAIRAKEGENISKYIVGNLLKTEEGYIEEIKIAQFKGYRIINVFEGCGADSYYFSINDGKTLFVRREHITELILNPQRYSSAEGVIMSQESDVLFDQILSTFKLIEK
ncbi:hypothetical protein KKB43_02305 [Patescibacteria group bacterium]|nr:hypothetical protein [Patescibacteria group bacterium]MBU4579824.1 hypothetical protein [Patescibacteria group bacterium]